MSEQAGYGKDHYSKRIAMRALLLFRLVAGYAEVQRLAPTAGDPHR